MLLKESKDISEQYSETDVSGFNQPELLDKFLIAFRGHDAVISTFNPGLESTYTIPIKGEPPRSKLFNSKDSPLSVEAE